MIPLRKSKNSSKPSHVIYGTPKGWDFENGSVAFGETEKKEMRRKSKRVSKPDAI